MPANRYGTRPIEYRDLYGLPLERPSISHHLNVLKQAGMVLDERRGQNIYYSLNTSVFEEVVAFTFELLGRKDPGKMEKEECQ